MKIGYARVSSVGQNLDSQIEALEKAGCQKIFTEKKSGTQSSNRHQLKEAIDFCRSGDVFVVSRLDRCSRNVKDLHTIIDLLHEKDVDFKATEQELDTSTSSGRLMIGLLSIVSAFETDLRAERQADGIASAISKGKKWGRVPINFTDEMIQEALSLQDTLTNQEIADKFGIGRSTMLKYFQRFKEKQILEK